MPSGYLTLHESAQRAGGHRWVEARLFVILGGWVASTRDVEAKLLFDRHSQHHAWRAAQWWDRLPVLADVDRESLVGAPDAGIERAFEDLAASDGVVERLAGAYRVALPRLAARYRAHLQVTSPAADGATIRTLDLLVPDVARDWQEGELLLQGMLVDAEAVQRAAAAVAGLERLLTSLHSVR